MTEQDYELLSQYLDGELAAPVAQELRKRLIAEPQLRASLERLKAVDNSVKDAFAVPGADAVPARIVKMVANAKTRTGGLPVPRRAGWGLAVAASLVAATGLLLTPDWRHQTPEHPAGSATGDALLASVLEHSASRAEGWDALADGRQVRPLLSFQDTEGGWCREYLLSDEGSTWHGVACRSAALQWATEVLSIGALAGSANEYRPAGTADSDEIASFINTHSADIALSLKEEADLIASKWQ